MGTIRRLLCAGVCAGFPMLPGVALACGDEGHEVVALVAQHYLDPAVRQKVEAMLAADDTDPAVPHDIAHEATWADKYRDSSRERYNATHQWHFVDLEIDDPNLDQACFGRPGLSQDTPASEGSDRDCVVDKIDEFADELAAPSTEPEERLLALKFLLHFVGGIHQPLHAADRHDHGGNDVHVSANGLPVGKLHEYWDTEFVARLGADPAQVAAHVIQAITDDNVREWSTGDTAEWAKESYQLAHDAVYDQVPKPAHRNDVVPLSDAYVDRATEVVRGQLAKAGVRLAHVLNTSLAH